MDLLGALSILVRVAETGSFSAVARERQISKAGVARHISQLEGHFGVRLFHRTTRKLSVTGDGNVLLYHARPVLAGIEGMESVLSRQKSSPSGLVRVGLSAAASRYLASRLPDLLAKYPELTVEFVIGDQFGDMIEDRLDLALRIGELSDASQVSQHAGTSPRITVATPSYIKATGPVSKPSELVHHTCLVHDTGPDSNVWTFVTPGGRESVRVSSRFFANDSSAVRLAARAGCGIAFLPLVEVYDDLRAGELAPVLIDFPAAGVPLFLVYPSRRHLAPRTRLVMEFIRRQIRDIEKVLTISVDQSSADLGRPSLVRSV
jgi:DNA-binding transcriptional LysR family regulator